MCMQFTVEIVTTFSTGKHVIVHIVRTYYTVSSLNQVVKGRILINPLQPPHTKCTLSNIIGSRK